MTEHLREHLVNAVPFEYIADKLGAAPPPLRDMSDLASAKSVIERYMSERIDAVAQVFPGRPAVLLSGGIDSSSIAAELAYRDADPLCVTVVCGEHDARDKDRATAVAQSLNVEHIMVMLSDSELKLLTQDAVKLLASDELWEVGAAATLLAAYRSLAARTPGPIYTGIGTDVLFSGGRYLCAPLGTDAARRELTASIWRILNEDFTSSRLIPDFFERLLGETEAQRVIQAWTTTAGWHMTKRFGPEVLYGISGNGIIDKLCLRDRTVDVGLANALAWGEHDSMQKSNGMFSAFAALGRSAIAADPVASTYSNPNTEASDIILARQWVRSLG